MQAQSFSKRLLSSVGWKSTGNLKIVYAPILAIRCSFPLSHFCCLLNASVLNFSLHPASSSLPLSRTALWVLFASLSLFLHPWSYLAPFLRFHFHSSILPPLSRASPLLPLPLCLALTLSATWSGGIEALGCHVKRSPFFPPPWQGGAGAHCLGLLSRGTTELCKQWVPAL